MGALGWTRCVYPATIQLVEGGRTAKTSPAMTKTVSFFVSLIGTELQKRRASERFRFSMGEKVEYMFKWPVFFVFSSHLFKFVSFSLVFIRFTSSNHFTKVFTVFLLLFCTTQQLKSDADRVVVVMTLSRCSAALRSLFKWDVGTAFVPPPSPISQHRQKTTDGIKNDELSEF